MTTTTQTPAALNIDTAIRAGETYHAVALRLAGDILRASGLPIETLDDGTVLPDLSGESLDSDEADGGGWINCSWGSHKCGGAWVAGVEVTPYKGCEITGGTVLTADVLCEMGLPIPLDDALLAESLAEVVVERIQRASVREAKRVLSAAK